jgi:hypothetical protein
VVTISPKKWIPSTSLWTESESRIVLNWTNWQGI